MKISFVIPIFNQASVFRETYKCIKQQSYSAYEIIIGNDNSTDGIAELVDSLSDDRIIFINFKENVGYSRNLARTLSYARGDIVVLLGADDLFSKNYLERIVEAFRDPEVLGITRAYYWFSASPLRAVRLKDSVCNGLAANVKISLSDNPRIIEKLLSSCDQLSLLAVRNHECLNKEIRDDIFTAHVYLIANALKKGKVCFLSGLPLAVRIGVSQTRKISHIYTDSPTEQWLRLINFLAGTRLPELKIHLTQEWIAKNYLGLLQIRNYGSFKSFIREVSILYKLRRANLLSAEFILIVLLCLFTPRYILRKLVDLFKDSILSRKLRDVALD